MNRMAIHGEHCPFLNRSDDRCGNHFSLSRLQHAFSHCFSDYEVCPVYLEMLAERRARAAAQPEEAFVGAAAGASHDQQNRLIQVHVKLAPRYPKRSA